eukprot:Hpha_TRINITY_DN5042_c0_g1::TRINITY_DN5042_c0_g1_i1::g.94208::m.94208
MDESASLRRESSLRDLLRTVSLEGECSAGLARSGFESVSDFVGVSREDLTHLGLRYGHAHRILHAVGEAVQSPNGVSPNGVAAPSNGVAAPAAPPPPPPPLQDEIPDVAKPRRRELDSSLSTHTAAAAAAPPPVAHATHVAPAVHSPPSPERSVPCSTLREQPSSAAPAPLPVQYRTPMEHP